MYSEEIKYLSHGSDENTHVNEIRNSYFENRSCMTNVLDFLDQEVVIIPSCYFSYPGGISHSLVDSYIGVLDHMEYDDPNSEIIIDSLGRLDTGDCYHISVLDNYITIVADNHRCVFTNKDMKGGNVIGTIIWVRNFNELLKKFGDRKLKRISKAIIFPYIIKHPCPSHSPLECLDNDFFLFMDIYYPEIAFKYTIDTHMSNVCIDVYNKLTKDALNGLVDKYIPSYRQCDGYGEKGEVDYSIDICKCGGLRAFCYLDF